MQINLYTDQTLPSCLCENRILYKLYSGYKNYIFDIKYKNKIKKAS